MLHFTPAYCAFSLGNRPRVVDSIPCSLYGGVCEVIRFLGGKSVDPPRKTAALQSTQIALLQFSEDAYRVLGPIGRPLKVRYVGSEKRRPNSLLSLFLADIIAMWPTRVICVALNRKPPSGYCQIPWGGSFFGCFIVRFKRYVEHWVCHIARVSSIRWIVPSDR